MSTKTIIAAFYKFFDFDDYAEQKEPLETFCKAHDVFGTILVAHEGVNGTIAGPRAGIDAVLAYLRSDARMADL
ncbi:MAG: hypothetical protein KDE51_26135, partial [Anaerolineales bacterium]|nr:hypothetical protein [Anaerolineales bacterium]